MLVEIRPFPLTLHVGLTIALPVPKDQIFTNSGRDVDGMKYRKDNNKTANISVEDSL